MADYLLTLNLGSSSLKYGLYHWPSLACHKTETRDFDSQTDAAIALALQLLLDEIALLGAGIIAVGHRVVHGGQQFTQPVIIDNEVLSDLEALVVLAPLHLPAELAAIRWLNTQYPDIPQVACFDTAFHAEQPTLARLYGLPRQLTEQGVIRYGFHGLSYQFISRRMQQCLPKKHQQRVVVAHLGSGASMCAMNQGKSMATTMGFSALEGLMMGTRSGDLDPGVLLHLLQQKNMSVADVEHMLYKKSGLLGVSGISNDVRVLEASDVPEAQQALDLFAYRAALQLGSLSMALGGVDAVIFTAGIGEHSAGVRQKMIGYLSWLGAEINIEANQQHAMAIHAEESQLGIYVLATNEELMIAEQTYRLIV